MPRRLATWLITGLRTRVVYRIFIPFFLIIVLGVAMALPYGITVSSRIMEENANSQVQAVAAVALRSFQRDLDKLLTFCELKIYSSPIQEAIDQRDIPKLRQLIIPMKSRSKVGIVVVFDREGNDFLRLDQGILAGVKLRDLQIVRNGLNGMLFQDIITVGGRLIMCAIAPNETVRVAGGMNGAMLVGQVVDDRLAEEIRQLTGADVVVSNSGGRAVASSFGERGPLMGQVDPQEVAGPPGMTEGEGRLDTLMIHGKPFRVVHRSLTVHGEPRAIITILSDVSGIYRSRRNVIAVMIVLMFLGVGAAVLVSLRIAQSISRPINTLVQATELTAAGDLTQRIEDISRDEIGRLSASFNTMVGRIRRDIEEIQEARNRAQAYSREMEQINTELKQARSELVQASKMVAMGQLGAGVAHELNQPLLAIGLFAEQTLKYLPEGSPECRSVERIIEQTDRMSRIINEIRLFARQSLLEPEELDINEPVRRAVGLVERQLADANIRLSLELSPGLAAVLGDANQLQQVFLNLVTNARDAMAPRGRGNLHVTSSSFADGQFVSVDITDDGEGIRPDILSDIFLPFFSTKKESKGLGLGLSISYGIIQRHSGVITVHSAPGDGTTFGVILPTVLAKHCWEMVDCQTCRPDGGRERCPVYTRDQGFFCWAYFRREGEDSQVSLHCQKCPVYKAHHSFIPVGGVVA